MESKRLFSDRQLAAMIVPLFMEQLLVMLIGLADTLIVSHVGEAAVSGVSLVNQFNTIFIYLFTALASGGAVVVSQYIGRRDRDSAGRSASQLLMFSTLFSLALMAAVLIHNVFNAFAFPFSGALSNGLRAAGDVRYTMIVSIASTVAGRMVLSYILGVMLNMGVVGLAFAMAFDWTVRAVLFVRRQKSGRWKLLEVI